MKKTYIAPTMQVFTMQMTQKLCMASIESNVGLNYGGGTDAISDFDSDDIR